MMQEVADEVEKSAKNAVYNIHTAIPGKIVAVDKAKGTVDVDLYGKYTLSDGTRLDYPKLSSVPLVMPYVNGVKSPMKPGTDCIVIIAENELDGWRTGADSQTPRRFDLTNALCVPGLLKTGEALSDNIELSIGGTKLVVSAGGIEITGNVKVSGNVNVSQTVTASTDVVGGGKSLKGHSHAYTWTDDGGSGKTAPPS